MKILGWKIILFCLCSSMTTVMAKDFTQTLEFEACQLDENRSHRKIIVSSDEFLVLSLEDEIVIQENYLDMHEAEGEELLEMISGFQAYSNLKVVRALRASETADGTIHFVLGITADDKIGIFYNSRIETSFWTDKLKNGTCR